MYFCCLLGHKEWYLEQHQITDYIKDLHTVIFFSPTGCGKSHRVLNLIKKNATNILTTLLFAQCSDGTRLIILRLESDMMTTFGSLNQRISLYQ